MKIWSTAEVHLLLLEDRLIIANTRAMGKEIVSRLLHSNADGLAESPKACCYLYPTVSARLDGNWGE